MMNNPIINDVGLLLLVADGVSANEIFQFNYLLDLGLDLLACNFN